MQGRAGFQHFHTQQPARASEAQRGEKPRNSSFSNSGKEKPNHRWLQTAGESSTLFFSPHCRSRERQREAAPCWLPPSPAAPLGAGRGTAGAAGLIPGPCGRRVPVGLLLAPPAAGHRPEHPLTWLLPAGPHSQPQGHGHGFAGRRRDGRAPVLHKHHVGCLVPVLEPAPDGGTLLWQAQRQRWAPCPGGGGDRALGALRENTAPRGVAAGRNAPLQGDC